VQVNFDRYGETKPLYQSLLQNSRPSFASIAEFTFCYGSGPPSLVAITIFLFISIHFYTPLPMMTGMG
jgi:hypothetical protein